FGEQLRAFARITCRTTSGDILTSDDRRIIDDVFPGGARLAGATSRTPLGHLDPAINARPVPCAYFFFEPCRDAPGVHLGSRPSLNDLVRSPEHRLRNL